MTPITIQPQYSSPPPPLPPGGGDGLVVVTSAVEDTGGGDLSLDEGLNGPDDEEEVGFCQYLLFHPLSSNKLKTSFSL